MLRRLARLSRLEVIRDEEVKRKMGVEKQKRNTRTVDIVWMCEKNEWREVAKENNIIDIAESRARRKVKLNRGKELKRTMNAINLTENAINLRQNTLITDIRQRRKTYERIL